MRLGLFLLALFLAASIARGENSFYQPSVRSPRQGEVIYFLLPDRFNDGNPANNEGKSAAGSEWIRPVDPHLFHGGDFRGNRAKTRLPLSPGNHVHLDDANLSQSIRAVTLAKACRPKRDTMAIGSSIFWKSILIFGSKEDLRSLIERAKAAESEPSSISL